MAARDVRVALFASLGTLALVHLYSKYVSPVLFARHIRKLHREALHRHGETEPCVLDVRPDNMLNFKQGKFDPIIDDLRLAGVPDHLVDYIEKLLIARGVAKAFLVREELVNYKKVLKHFIYQYEEVEAELKRFTAIVYKDRCQGTDDDKFRLVTLQRSIQLARGALHVLKCARTWTRAILNVPRYPTPDYAKLFLAGDTAIWVQPRGMLSQDILDKLRRVVAKDLCRIRARVAADGWPPTQCNAAGNFEVCSCCKGNAMVVKRSACKHNNMHSNILGQCKVCHNKLGKTWVRHGVCWRCADVFREQGLCPYERDNPRTLCPHWRKCFGCEHVSCEECGLLRGDGSAVLELAKRIEPKAVFLDFDQTLCNTKSGAPPTLGKARFNPDLVTLAKTHNNVHIVTRQNTKNTPALRAALDVVGLAHVPFHCLGRSGTRKGDIIGQHLSPGDSGLFVDDTIAEHLDEALTVHCPGLHRVLFCSTNYSLTTASKEPI